MPIALVRHATAGSRKRWEGPDFDRPLDPGGHAQAGAIARELADLHVTRILSSPALRCQQTVGPLALGLELPVELTKALAEGRDASKALALVDGFAADGVTAALCSHGDIIPDLLGLLEQRGVDLGGVHKCGKGSIWLLDVTDGSVTRGRYLPPA